MKKLLDPDCFEKAFAPRTWHDGRSQYFFMQKRRDYRIYPLIADYSSKEVLVADRINFVTLLPGAYYRRVNSNHISIEFILEGSLAVRQDGRSFLAEKNEIFLMRPETENEYLLLPGPPCRKISLTIFGPLLIPMIKACGLDSADVLTDVDTVRWRETFHLFQELSLRNTENSAEQNRDLCFLALNLLRGTARRTNIPEVFRELKSRMEHDPCGDFSIERMSKLTGVSCNWLIRRFREYFGTPPHRKLMEIRLCLAAKLLITREELSIKEISECVGYRDQLNFSTEFRKKYGVSPTAFRKKTFDFS